MTRGRAGLMETLGELWLSAFNVCETGQRAVREACDGVVGSLSVAKGGRMDAQQPLSPRWHTAMRGC